MQFIINRNTSPGWNLALEEYALTKMNRDVIMLWRNSSSVIIGRNQNAAEEMDMDYIKANNIAVIRRQSGGGAVFHDLGNLNFTVIHALGDDDFSNYARFTAPIVEFLRELGVDARLEGRNDLVIDGMKFSGNAQAVKGGRIMHHGTILYKADVSHLASALKPRPVKIESKGVKSVRSRITNVYEHLASPMPVEEFFERLAAFFLAGTDGEYRLTEEDIAAVDKLVEEKYGTWEWNIGSSPAYNYEKSARFPSGIVDLRMTVTDGVIREAHIFGDFFGVRDKAALEDMLTGLRHDRDAVAKAIADVELGEYIHGVSAEEFVGLL